MSKLDGKTAVVTGGSSGIGYATAKKIRELGAKVIITGRNPEAVDKAAKEIGAVGLVADQASLSDTGAIPSSARSRPDQLAGQRARLFDLDVEIAVRHGTDHIRDAVADRTEGPQRNDAVIRVGRQGW